MLTDTEKASIVRIWNDRIPLPGGCLPGTKLIDPSKIDWLQSQGWTVDVHHAPASGAVDAFLLYKPEKGRAMMGLSLAPSDEVHFELFMRFANWAKSQGLEDAFSPKQPGDSIEYERCAKVGIPIVTVRAEVKKVIDGTEHTWPAKFEFQMKTDDLIRSLEALGVKNSNNA